MSTIKIISEDEPVADYHYIRTKKIYDTKPKTKRGVTGYFICAYMWCGKWKYYANIDANWFIDTIPEFDSLRAASHWIRKYMYT